MYPGAVHPAVHDDDPAVLLVPFAQLVHAVALPIPYVPAAQVWQMEDTPSTKYVPDPQQTAEPEMVQCTVPLGQDMVHWSRSAGYTIHSSMDR